MQVNAAISGLVIPLASTGDARRRAEHAPAARAAVLSRRRRAGRILGVDAASYAREVRVNLGGEPDWEEPGLPPAGIEVPDDARELDRDVQAYRREQRALRRRLRRRRWGAPLARTGIVVPLLAGCLILALIAGTLLTIFAAWPGN